MEEHVCQSRVGREMKLLRRRDDEFKSTNGSWSNSDVGMIYGERPSTNDNFLNPMSDLWFCIHNVESGVEE